MHFQTVFVSVRFVQQMDLRQLERRVDRLGVD